LTFFLSATNTKVLKALGIVLKKKLRKICVPILDFTLCMLPLEAAFALDPFFTICLSVVPRVKVNLNTKVTILVFIVS
jgi:hypothetical protein